MRDVDSIFWAVSNGQVFLTSYPRQKLPAFAARQANLERVQMTTWLWIIGITAVVWPLIVALFLEIHIDKCVQTNFRRYGLMHEGMDKAVKGEISKLQMVLEKQDALIAALWQKTFGFYHGEVPYDSADLPEYLGMKPQWHAHQGQWAGPIDYLVRYEPYPWGTHAKKLYFPE